MIYAEKGLLCQGHGGPGGTEQSASLENIDEYIAYGGYEALGKVLTEMEPEDVISDKIGRAHV